MSDVSRTIRFGFVGAGFSARLQAEGLKKVTGHRVTLAGVTATRLENARRFAADHGVAKVYATYQELLADPTIEAVCICVPNALHAEVIIAAAHAGKHVVCEKPMTGAFGDNGGLTGADRAKAELERARETVARIRAAVRAAGILFLYAENWVYAPAVLKTKRLLEVSGGAILDMRAEESHSGSHALRSRRRESAGGGSLAVLGSHPIGAALHLKSYESRLRGRNIRLTSVNAEVADLYDSEAARSVRHDWIVSDWADVETWASVILGFSDGTKASITASFAMLGGVRNVLEVYTTNSVYRANMTPNNGLDVFTPDPAAFGTEYLHEKVESRTGWISAAPDEDWVRGYPQEMQDFVECIAETRQPLSGLDLAADVVEVIYASYLSAAQGRRIEIR